MEDNTFTRSCVGHKNRATSVAQQMLNGLDLLVFRLKAKELIYTVLYECRLLEYTILTTPKRIIAVAIVSDILPVKSRLRQLLEYD